MSNEFDVALLNTEEALSIGIDIVYYKGDKGDKGDTGTQGIQGEQGIQGVKGEKGDKGDTGARGEKGEKGDTGAQGEKGVQGIQGLKGDKGDTGEKGADGTGSGDMSKSVYDQDGDGVVDYALLADGLSATASIAMTQVAGLSNALSTKQAAGNYLTAETDPTVPAWAKAATKPSYTASEVGAAIPATELTLTVLASAWQGTAAPYTAAVPVAGITEDSKGDAGPSPVATPEQRAASRGAMISLAPNTAGHIHLIADGDKPTVDLPILIRVVS